MPAPDSGAGMRFFWIQHGNLLKDKGLGIPWKWKICLLPKSVCWIMFCFFQYIFVLLGRKKNLCSSLRKFQWLILQRA